MKIKLEFDNHEQMVDWARTLLGLDSPVRPGPMPDTYTDPDCISELDLTTRTQNVLLANGYDKIWKLVNLLQQGTPAVLKIPNMGRRHLREVVEALEAYQQKRV